MRWSTHQAKCEKSNSRGGNNDDDAARLRSVLGSGSHYVFALHGWCGRQTAYAPMYDALSPDELTYICPSNRGYGGSRGIHGEYTVDEIARDLLALADSLKVAQES